jgi:hypothetical protein
MPARQRTVPAAFAAVLLLPSVLWFWPALVQHQAPSLRDQGDFFYPLKLYTADRIRSGEIPLWNPLSGAGEPWLANLQSGVFYPPTLLFLLPSAGLAGALFLLFHFAVAIWGARRFLRAEGMSEPASWIGAGVFSCSGFAVSLSAYWNHFGAFCYLPAVVSFARSGLRSRGSRLAAAALLAVQAMAGSPEMSAATVLVFFALAWKARPVEETWADPPPGRRLARAIACAAMALALTAWAVVPAAELARVSDRRSALPAGERDSGAAGGAAVPSCLGLSAQPSGTSYLSTLYVGPVALLLAGAAFSERERRKLAISLAVIAGAGILLAASGPPGSWLRSVAPLDRLRYPAKALALPAFGISMLAGIGADALRFARVSRAGLFRGLAVAGLLVLLVSRQSPAIRLAGAAALLTMTALTWGTDPGSGGRGMLQWAGAILLIGSLTLAARGALAFAPESELRRVPASHGFLASVPGYVLTPPMRGLVSWVLRDSRFDSETLRRQREALLGYTNLQARVRTIRTAAPLATAAAVQIADSIDQAPDLQRAAGAFGARVLWTPFPPPGLGSRKVGEFFRAPLNPFRPRLSVVRSYRVENDGRRAERQAADGSLDAREVLLDRSPSPAPLAAGHSSYTVARLAEDRPERVAIDTSSDSPGILVLLDLWYPGWTARVDGRPAPILRANGVFRAVALPAGSHRVLFRYRPVSFYAGAAISAVAWVALLLLWVGGAPSRDGVLL